MSSPSVLQQRTDRPTEAMNLADAGDFMDHALKPYFSAVALA